MFLLNIVDKYYLYVKKRKIAPTTTPLDVPSHSIHENRILWNNYDWSKGGGEEWTENAKTYRGIDPGVWKNRLVNQMMKKYIREKSAILEIGPGAGRWSEILLNLANRLVLADISPKCLSICKERFRESKIVEYHLINDRLDFLGKESINYIWSYDVFVHINPTDIRNYLSDFQRILKPGGIGIIHHADKYSSERHARVKGYRSYMNAELFAKIVKEFQMEILEQNFELSHIPGDVISVFSKPY
jgi:SAM-dependent methyltransferase